MRKLWSLMFSDLNLDGSAPVRARPNVGEWGPVNVISTAQKKRLRVWTSVIFLVALVVVVLLGRYFYRLVMGL